MSLALRPDVMLLASGICKQFVLHARDVVLPVLENLEIAVRRGECVVLDGPSGTGKSSLLRVLYGNYVVEKGSVVVRGPDGPADLALATPREILALRRSTIGYVSQFLHAIPRVPALDVVSEPLLERGVAITEARDRAAQLLSRLNLPATLWQLPPTTFSGGEQQRVNIARGLIARHPILLLDEPTAALDAGNREIVAKLIKEALDDGTAIVAIFHDPDARERVATRRFDLTQFRAVS